MPEASSLSFRGSNLYRQVEKDHPIGFQQHQLTVSIWDKHTLSQQWQESIAVHTREKRDKLTDAITEEI